MKIRAGLSLRFPLRSQAPPAPKQLSPQHIAQGLRPGAFPFGLGQAAYEETLPSVAASEPNWQFSKAL